MIFILKAPSADDAAQCQCELCTLAHEVGYASPCAEVTKFLNGAEPAPTEADIVRAELEDTQRVAHYQRETIAAHLSTIDSQRKIIAGLTEQIRDLQGRILGYDADMAGTVRQLESAREGHQIVAENNTKLAQLVKDRDEKLKAQAEKIASQRGTISQLSDRLVKIERALRS